MVLLEVLFSVFVNSIEWCVTNLDISSVCEGCLRCLCVYLRLFRSSPSVLLQVDALAPLPEKSKGGAMTPDSGFVRKSFTVPPAAERRSDDAWTFLKSGAAGSLKHVFCQKVWQKVECSRHSMAARPLRCTVWRPNSV